MNNQKDSNNPLDSFVKRTTLTVTGKAALTTGSEIDLGDAPTVEAWVRAIIKDELTAYTKKLGEHFSK